MSSKGIKRASPGADEEKNPLGDVELSDEDAGKLQVLQKDTARTELGLERHAQQKLLPLYTRRRTTVKAIPKFWPVALMNHSVFASQAQHNADQLALSYLEDLWMVRDKVETRCFVLEFYFKENPYFTNRVLKKEYKFNPSTSNPNEKPDGDGIVDSMLEFSWERDVEAKAFKIDWKDEAHNLTKLYPRVLEEDGDDLPADGGSFFNFFELAEDVFDLGVVIANDIFPEAIDYFLGNAGGDEIDSDDEDEEDEEDEEEIDLEKPRLKKPRQK